METDLFWYENPGKTPHATTEVTDLRLLGGTVTDLPDRSRAAVVVDQCFGRSGIFRFERPADSTATWDVPLIRDDFETVHNLAVVDINTDGRPELVSLSLGS